MDITIIRLTEEAYEKRNYRDLYAIKIDGKEVFLVQDGESEDNTLRRNFNDVYSLINILKLVHKVGINGEKLIITNEEVEEY